MRPNVSPEFNTPIIWHSKGCSDFIYHSGNLSHNSNPRRMSTDSLNITYISIFTVRTQSSSHFKNLDNGIHFPSS